MNFNNRRQIMPFFPLYLTQQQKTFFVNISYPPVCKGFLPCVLGLWVVFANPTAKSIFVNIFPLVRTSGLCVGNERSPHKPNSKKYFCKHILPFWFAKIAKKHCFLQSIDAFCWVPAYAGRLYGTGC